MYINTFVLLSLIIQVCYNLVFIDIGASFLTSDLTQQYVYYVEFDYSLEEIYINIYRFSKKWSSLLHLPLRAAESKKTRHKSMQRKDAVR